MTMPAQHRQALVRAAVALFRKQGYAATGLSDILARSGAPKGSLYHYFPGGKAELGEAAVRQATATVTSTLSQLRDQSPNAAELIGSYVDLLASWMRKSNWRDGCPIATTLLETAGDLPRVAAAGREAFAAWTAILSAALESDGVDPTRARRLGRFAISALEGALIQAKVERAADPLLEARDGLLELFRSAGRRSSPPAPSGRPGSRG
jgi:TetR/AcrR family transcriptional repressor of lmrAB and yxaGH operons